LEDDVSLREIHPVGFDGLGVCSEPTFRGVERCAF
jgi:hypothetical protein